jgi:hypothetical protein
MRCGVPAVTLVTRRFVLADEGALDAGLLGSSLWEYHVAIPVCRRHRHMWLVSRLMIAAAVVAPLVFLGCAVVVPLLYGLTGRGEKDFGPLEMVLGGIVCIGTPASLIYALTIVLSWRTLAIRAVSGNEEWVVLSGVSPRFLEACQRPPAPAQQGADPGRDQAPARPPDVLPVDDDEPVEPPRPMRRRKRPRKGDEVGRRTKLRVWGGACIIFGLAAVVLPRAGLQFEILSGLGWYAPVAGAAIAILGAILLTASNYVRDREEDDEAPP